MNVATITQTINKDVECYGLKSIKVRVSSTPEGYKVFIRHIDGEVDGLVNTKDDLANILTEFHNEMMQNDDSEH